MNKVFVSQPPGFEDYKNPEHVYKLKKAMYGLKYAPRQWYETLSEFLFSQGYDRGTSDKTLFIKKKKEDIILVQVYVDDIIFGSTNEEMCEAFVEAMKSEFEMSMLGEMNFFLGLQLMALSSSLLQFLWWFAEASMDCRWNKALLRVVVALDDGILMELFSDL